MVSDEAGRRGSGRPRRVLVLNQYFPPDTSATAKMTQQVVRALAERFDVTVVAGRPSYDPTERHPYYLGRKESEANISVERVGSTAFDRRRPGGRSWNYLSYALLAIPRAMSTPADVIVSMTDPPFAGIIGALVARLRRLPFVYNVRDLHPDMAVASGMLRPNAATRMWDKAHRWALRSAQKVVVLGEDMRQRIQDKGVAANRIEIIRDGAPLIDATLAPDPTVAAEVRGPFSFVALHAGNLGFAGAWSTLVKAMKLVQTPGIGLVFVGGGAAQKELGNLAGESDRIRFLQFFPARQVPHVLAAADVHIVTVRRGIEGLVVPSKLYPILAAGGAVLAVAAENSDVARVVREHDCGLVADPDDPAQVAAALDRLAGDRGGLARMAANARRSAGQFEASAQLRRFVNLVDQI